MNIIRAVLFPGLLGSCAIAGSHANLSAPQGFIDEQIGAQYPRGTVFVVRQKGLFGVNPECTTFAMATYKEDGRLHSPGLAQRAAAVGAGCLLRNFPVGWKFYSLGALSSRKDGRVVFPVQECDSCNGGWSASYKAVIEFRIPQDSMQIRDAIAQVFSVDDTPPAEDGTAAAPEATIGSVYVNSQDAADRLQLNSNSCFHLQEGGQTFSGTYYVDGAALKLHITELNKDVEILIDGTKLVVNGEEIWVQPKR